MKKKLILALRWTLPVVSLLFSLFFYTAIPGFSFSGLIWLGICGILLCYNIFTLLYPRFPKTVKWIRRVFTGVLCLGILVVAVTCGIVVNTALQEPVQNCEYIVVLGCKVNPTAPSLSLQERIDAAYEYLMDNPNTIAVVSGGQGHDEPMSEAQCMFQQLTAMGIPENRIWMEDKATSTWENLNFSLNLIEEKTGVRPKSIGLLSSEYHLFRAMLQAKAYGVETVGIPATTKWVALRINNYLREVAGVWHYFILGGQYSD